MVTNVAGLSHTGRLFYVHDRNSNTCFLVDTGAKISVIPPTLILKVCFLSKELVVLYCNLRCTFLHSEHLASGILSAGYSLLLMSSKLF